MKGILRGNCVGDKCYDFEAREEILLENNCIVFKFVDGIKLISKPLEQYLQYQHLYIDTPVNVTEKDKIKIINIFFDYIDRFEKMLEENTAKENDNYIYSEVLSFNIDDYISRATLEFLVSR